MKLKLFASVFAITLLAAASSVSAHHSFAATYFEDKTMQIEGKLVQFQFRNPHSFIQLEVKDEKGEVVRWSVEWGGAAQLGSQGVTNETLKYGDVVSIIAIRAVSPKIIAYECFHSGANRTISDGDNVQERLLIRCCAESALRRYCWPCWTPRLSTRS